MCGSPSRPEEIHAVRIAAGGARLLLGCDLVVSASAEALSKLRARAQPRDRQQPRDDHRRFHPQPRSACSRPRAAAQHRRGGRTGATPSFSTRPGSRPGFSAIRSRAICSCSAMPISAGWCRCRPRRSSGAIELNARRRRIQPRAFRWGRRAAVDPALVESARDPAAARCRRATASRRPSTS